MISPCPEDVKRLTLEYLLERFGLSAALFAKFEFYAGARGRVILGPKRIDAALSPDTAGLLIARIGRTVKPSSNLLQLFGDHVNRSVITLTREQTINYVKGNDLDVAADQVDGVVDGYVLLRYLAFSLGCGLLQKGHVKNMLPKAKRLEVKYL